VLSGVECGKVEGPSGPVVGATPTTMSTIMFVPDVAMWNCTGDVEPHACHLAGWWF